MATVSVIMTCYNEGAYIGPAVNSILSQTRSDLVEKIVIVDDGSEAATIEVLSQLATRDPRIQVIYSKGNGLPRARNIAAANVTSDWIAILDGDDIWLPEKIERQLAKVEGRSDVGLVYTGVWMFDNDAPEQKTSAKINDLGQSKNLERDYFMKDGPIIPSSALIRRRVFEEAGAFDPSIKVFEDTEFYARLARYCRFAFVPEPLIEKRNHPASITARRGEMMAHHAFVAFFIARNSPQLQPLIRPRLSDRARKLGNTAMAIDAKAEALRYYALALSLTPFSFPALISYLALKAGLPIKQWRQKIIQARSRSVTPA